MKYCNKTNCPDDIMKVMVLETAKMVGVDDGCDFDIIIKQRRAPYPFSEGFVLHKDEIGVMEVKFPKRQGWDFGGGIYEVDMCDGLEIMHDWIDVANQFFDILVHEWRHVKDVCDGTLFPYRRGKPWARRISEIKAQAEIRIVREKIANGLVKDMNDDILELAVWLEGC